MIINASRAKLAKTCWRKIFNTYHRQLGQQKTSSLVDGSSFHKGVAMGLATGNWAEAIRRTKDFYDEEVKTSNIMPEQVYLIEDHWQLVKAMIELYATNFQNEEVTVLQPECEFDVELPRSEHNCIWLHHFDLELNQDCWEPPLADKILRKSIVSPHPVTDIGCKCYSRHRLVGRTDDVVKWQGNVWLEDHKTSAIQGDQFWDQFELDLQQTAYIYGFWKKTGLRPRGFVINHIFRPSEKQVSAWNAKRLKTSTPKSELDYLKYERRPFLRTEEDLARLERDMVDLCDEWEGRIVSGKFPMEQTGGACLAYNRRCDFMAACLSHDNPNDFAHLVGREADYVEQKMAALIQIDPPTVA